MLVPIAFGLYLLFLLVPNQPLLLQVGGSFKFQPLSPRKKGKLRVLGRFVALW